MAVERQSSHDFQQIVCNIDGVIITGWAPDGGVTFEMGGDILEHEIGADGGVHLNRTNDKRVIATLSLAQNTEGCAYLGSLLNLQELTPGPIRTVSFFLRNFVSGEVVKSPDATFITRPAPNQESSKTGREFALLLPYAADKITWG